MIAATHDDIVVKLVELYRPKTYLELGVFFGATFNRIIPLVPRAIGVDLVKRPEIRGGEFYQCSTDDFFARFSDPVDFVFIDSNHHFDNVRRDFINSAMVLAREGVILLHDVDPVTKDLTHPERCGEAYKIIPWVREIGLFSVFVFCQREGVAIVSRLSDEHVRKW